MRPLQYQSCRWDRSRSQTEESGTTTRSKTQPSPRQKERTRKRWAGKMYAFAILTLYIEHSEG
jgi:hypothetical protein